MKLSRRDYACKEPKGKTLALCALDDRFHGHDKSSTGGALAVLKLKTGDSRESPGAQRWQNIETRCCPEWRLFPAPWRHVYSRLKRQQRETIMPFVHIQLVADTIADDSQAKKARIAAKIADALHEETGTAKTSVWVVFEEVAAGDWYVGDASVETIRKRRI